MGGPLVRDRTHVFGTFERDHVDTVRIIAHPPSNPFAARENGIFPARPTSEWPRSESITESRLHGLRAIRARQRDVDSNKSLPHPIEPGGYVQPRAQRRRRDRVESFVAVVEHAPCALVYPYERRNTAHARPDARHSATVSQHRADVRLAKFSRTRVVLSDAMFVSSGNHNMKLAARSPSEHTSWTHTFSKMGSSCSARTLRSIRISGTWPTLFQQQPPNARPTGHASCGVRAGRWRAASRLRLNLGLRYDVDPTLRINEFYERILSTPALAGLDRFVSSDRGTDTNNVQPRMGATYDLRGDGQRCCAAAGEYTSAETGHGFRCGR